MDYEEAFDAITEGAHVKFMPEYIEHRGRAFLITNLNSSGTVSLVYDGSKSSAGPPGSNHVGACVEQLQLL